MGRIAKLARENLPVKYPVRRRNRCQICGRSRGYYRKFGVCRICLRKLALEGKIPGMKKSSW